EAAQNEFVAPGTDQWSASGKFSFRSPDTRESGQFYWAQDGDNYLLRLVGPLGVGGAEVEMRDGLARVRAQGEEYFGADATSLLQDLTRMRIPMDQLSDLLLGRATTNTGSWQIRYLGRRELDSYILPE